MSTGSGYVLVAGCGFLGEALCDNLHALGAQVVGLTHSPESAERLAAGKDYAVHAADISDGSSLAQVKEKLGEQCRAVFHCASTKGGGEEKYRQVYTEGMRQLLAVFRPPWCLFTSSTSVYPQVEGEWVNEETKEGPASATGRCLREAEDLALASGGAAARLAGLYGPGRSILLQRFLSREAVIDGLEPDAAGRWINQIHRDDAASALVWLWQRQEKGIFNVSDNRPLQQREVYQHLGARFGLPLPPVQPPQPQRRRGWSNKRVSNGKLLSTGWVPRFPDYFSAVDSLEGQAEQDDPALN